MNALVVETSRGSLVESVHQVSAAVVDPGGGLVAAAGEADLLTVLRSAAKPFQAIPLVADGAAERFALTPEELALVSASHSSEPQQVERVLALLQRIGCAESDLVCGPHRPLWRDMTIRSPGASPIGDVPATPLASNCSGKHTGMLALARHHGWKVAGYHRMDHPVQRRCREEVSRWAGLPAESVPHAVDGCGVPCFAMPLRHMAGAFARLVHSSEWPARSIVSAMVSHPELVAGQGRLCTALMQAYPGRVLAKVGAEGVYGAGLIDRGLGIALKVMDGHGWSAVVALLAILEQLGLEPSPGTVLPQFAELPVRNTRREVVGAIRAAGRLTMN